ncbi:PTS sugar transporter subunit IIA [Treponema sp. HNW]|uniref:PTS sugar transporter subunit IIA n=1 Tax=Treponema sp. HNW TaxID=3116654 RepID=UPI003D14E59F
MLSDFILKHKTFLLQAEADGWQDAVKKSADLLIGTGCASPAYYDAILNAVKELGPYFVIAPGIAMPHARPEQGALKLGYALVCLKKPVSFGHSTNDPVDIILCITAPDKQALNEQAIIEVMNLFDNDKALSDLRNAKNEDDLKEILGNIHTEEKT